MLWHIYYIKKVFWSMFSHIYIFWRPILLCFKCSYYRGDYGFWKSPLSDQVASHFHLTDILLKFSIKIIRSTWNYHFRRQQTVSLFSVKCKKTSGGHHIAWAKNWFAQIRFFKTKLYYSRHVRFILTTLAAVTVSGWVIPRKMPFGQIKCRIMLSLSPPPISIGRQRSPISV